MSKILVPVDFSDYSLPILDVACGLARQMKASILILHVISKPYFPSVTGELLNLEDEYKAFEDEMKVKLSPHLSKLSAYASDKNIICEWKVIVERSAYEGIMKIADPKFIDLVIIGGKGASNLEHIFIGSVADKVIRHSKVPVFTINELGKKYTFKKIVFASDFTFPKENLLIDKLQRFAIQLNATLNFVKINTGNQLDSVEIDKIKQKYQLENLDIYLSKNIEKGILEYAYREKADIIAVASRGKKNVAHLFKGSFSNELVKHSSIPVLSYHLTNP